MKLLATLAASMLLASAAQAQTATFNFENQANTDFTGALTTASITNSGVTLTLTRPGSTFDFNDGAQFAANGAFGVRSLSPFSDERGTSSFIADFSAGLSAISIQYGDYGADSDIFTMSIYSGLGGTGTLLGTVTADYGLRALFDDDGVFTSTLSSGSAFRSAVFKGGSAEFPNSLYYDNIAVRVAGAVGPVPEPASWALMILGFGAVGGAMRRRRGATTVRFA